MAVVHVSIGLADIAEMLAEGERLGSAWLSASERKRSEAITAPRRRAQFLAGRWALRKLIATELEVDPLDCVLLAEENGPPRFSEKGRFPDSLHLSLSHSGDVVACAIAGSPVGIDVEACRERRLTDSLLAAALSPRERGRIEGLPEADVRSSFYAAWTLKEAWIKHAPPSQGVGLAHLPLIETARASETQPPNAWVWSGDGFTMALVAPLAPVVHGCFAWGQCLDGVVPVAWCVSQARTADVEACGTLG